jgi:hypothetical protein
MKTLIQMLDILRDAGVGEGVDTSRVEIKLRASGNMQLSLTHQSSGILAAVTVQPDYTIYDEDAANFEREFADIREAYAA